MVAEEASMIFYVTAPIIWGLVVGLIEIFFVMQDEGGMHPLVHGLHAIPTCLIFAFIAMNAPGIGMFLSNYVGFFGIPAVANITIPILIGIIATIKVKSAAAIVGGHGSVGEKLPHAFAIGILIAIAPFVWPFIEPVVPSLLNYKIVR